CPSTFPIEKAPPWSAVPGGRTWRAGEPLENRVPQAGQAAASGGFGWPQVGQIIVIIGTRPVLVCPFSSDPGRVGLRGDAAGGCPPQEPASGEGKCDPGRTGG